MSGPKRGARTTITGTAARLAFVLIALAVFAGRPEPARAHARLISSDPAAGSALGAVPAAFTLSFSEAVDLDFSAASLRDVNGSELPLGVLTLSTDERSLTVPVANPEAIPAGAYTLVWRVRSAVDGHVTTGVVAISAGTGAAPSPAGAAQSARPPWWRVAIRWLWLAGLIGAGGWFVYAAIIARRPVADLTPRSRAVSTASAALAVLAALLAGYDLGPSASASPPLDPPGLSVYGDLIRTSSTGRWWLGSALASAALLAVIARSAGRPAARWLGLGLAAFALLGFSASGHAASLSPAWLGIGVDWLHALAVATWIGALLQLWLALRSNVPPAAAIMTRFSRLGLGAVAVLLVTGFVRAAAHVGGPRNLTGDDYGVVLIAKHLLFAPILIAAGINQLVLVPRLRVADAEGAERARDPLLRSSASFVAIELAFAAAVLAAAATLTELAPADGPLPIDVAAKPVTIDQRGVAGDLDVWLLARLSGEATDRYSLTVTNADGRPPDGIQRVIIETSADIDGTAIGDRFDAEPLVGAPGAFVFPAVRLGVRGDWDMRVLVRRAGLEDVTTSFAVDTSAAGQPAPRLVDDGWRLPRGTIPAWSLGLFALFVLGGGLFALRRLRDVQPFAGAIVLTMTVLISAGFAVQAYRLTIPVTAATDLVNPIAADDASITRGGTLYAQLCLLCHGPTGAGIETDDPAHAHGSSADLTDGRTSGQRNGDLFHTIGAGVPDSAMPAYDQALTEAERWDLVNYLRYLQGQRGGNS